MATDQNYEIKNESNSKSSGEKILKREEENAFTLLLRKSTNIIIAPKGIQQIGISFAPERLGEYAASVQVRSGEWDRENICFCFCTSDLFHSLVYLFEVYILFDST